MAYWILKSEPETYSIDRLEKEKVAMWDGVRNYQARNNLRAMQAGDLAFFYHSGGASEIVGICEIAKTAYPDPTAQEGDWSAVDVQFKEKVKQPISLKLIKSMPEFQNLLIVRNSRISVSPVNAVEWELLLQLTNQSALIQ